MIAELRRKIVAMTMAVLLLLITIACWTTYCAVLRACDHVVQDMLEILAENRAGESGDSLLHLPRVLEAGDQELLSIAASASVYLVDLDAEGQVRAVSCVTGHEEPLPEETLRAILGSAGPSGGGAWRDFQYYRAEHPDGARVAISETPTGLRSHVRERMCREILPIVLLILVALFLLCWWLSAVVIRPVREVFQRQQQFLADAGHELKTPLASISVNAAVLAEDVGENRHLTFIQEEVRKMNTLIRRMMENAYVQEAGPEKERRQAVDLTELACQTVLPYDEQALTAYGVHCHLELEEGVTGRGDPERISQLMLILVDNAFKYAGEDGQVAVKLYRRGRHAVFEVGNSGPGIPREDMPHIFDRFYRCDKARPANGSYGLGLAIAREIAREQKGKLTAESTPGKWTRFCLIL